MSTDWWVASRNATLLTEALSRTNPQPVSTFDTIERKFERVEKTRLELLEILKKHDKSEKTLDTLTRFSLAESLDEYADFRYVYSDDDIIQLEKKLDWLDRIMQEKMNEMVLSYFMEVHRQSDVRAGDNDHDSGLLRGTLPTSHIPQAASDFHFRNDSDDDSDNDDENILHLWNRVDRLRNRLTRTTPQVQARADFYNNPRRLSPDQIRRIIEPLKARFQKSADSINFIPTMGEKQLEEYSQESLKRLGAAFPNFTTRKRVYFLGESNTRPSPTGHAEDLATMSVVDGYTNRQPNRYIFDLTAVDICTRNGQKFVVCTNEPDGNMILHHLPPHQNIFPSTNHRKVVGSTHDTEVSVEDDCLVEITGSLRRVLPEALPLYNFPSPADMLTFQAALRNKLIRQTFDVNSIHSKRGQETSNQHLKLWSDFNDENHTLSFYAKKDSARGTHLEIPVACFEPELKSEGTKCLRINFRQPRRSESKRRSWGSKQRQSSSKSRQDSFESGLSQTRGLFTRRRTTSENSSSQSPPLGTSQYQPPSRAGSIDSQSTGDTNFDLTTSTIATDVPPSDPHAHEMQYLEIRFTSNADLGSFNDEFLRVVQKKTKFRNGSIFHPRRSGPLPTPPTLAPIESEGALPVSSQDGVRLSVNERLNMNERPSANERVSVNETKEQAFKRDGIISDQVYRVHGIPKDYTMDNTKELLRSNLGLDRPVNVEVRSLALSLDQKTKTALVNFSNASSEKALDENEWSFKWFVGDSRAIHLNIDTHFIGLTTLYTPQSAIPEIDICTVPGLSGHAFDSFKENGKDGSYMWVLDRLPEEMPHARIMIYGFDPKLDGHTSEGGLKMLARGMIDALSGVGENLESPTSDDSSDHGATNVPLIFVCHSLGGLVVKQAMIEAETRQENSRFFQSIYGALFFGVPSQGLEIAALETLLKDQANLSWVRGFRKDAHTLTEQQVQFDEIIRNQSLHVEYYYETKMSPQLRKDPRDNRWKAIEKPIFIVKDSSATNDLLQSQEYSQYLHHIDRNHNELVKWKAHYAECMRVLRVLKKMKNAALAKENYPNGMQSFAEQPEFSKPPRRATGFMPPSRQPTGHMPPSRRGTGFMPPSRQATAPLPPSRQPTGFTSQSRRGTGFLPPSRQGTGFTEGFRRTHQDYQIGIICALAVEKAAVEAMLDEEHPRLPRREGDSNDYTLGRISVHNIVVACLPAGDIGIGHAATVANNMKRSFPIKLGLMVGVGGGVWSKEYDVRLGDVVVSEPSDLHTGVVHWDNGRMEAGGNFRRIGSMSKSPPFLRQLLQSLKAKHLQHGTKIPELLLTMFQKKPHMREKFKYQGLSLDQLFEAKYDHKGDQLCDTCDKSKIIQRDPRPDSNPRIHYGTIASGSEVMKHGVTRDRIAKKERVICFEMEAAGLMDDFPCLVIRGICDYADSHKNYVWQPYASATAAAFAKEFLSYVEYDTTNLDRPFEFDPALDSDA